MFSPKVYIAIRHLTLIGGEFVAFEVQKSTGKEMLSFDIHTKDNKEKEI